MLFPAAPKFIEIDAPSPSGCVGAGLVAGFALAGPARKSALLASSLQIESDHSKGAFPNESNYRTPPTNFSDERNAETRDA